MTAEREREKERKKQTDRQTEHPNSYYLHRQTLNVCSIEELKHFETLQHLFIGLRNNISTV